MDPVTLSIAKAAANRAPAATAANTKRLLNKLSRGAEDAAVQLIGDSTGNETTEWFHLWAVDFAARFPAYTVVYHLWDATGDAGYDTGSAPAAETLQTGTGAYTLHLWNFSIAGTQTNYGLGARWTLGIAPNNPDLVFISHGHNEGTGVGGAGYDARIWRAQYLNLTETLSAAFPYAGIVCILQNPQTANADQARRARAYEDISALRGYGTIDVHQAFLDTGAPANWIRSDGIHPATSADSATKSNGSRLWANTVLAATQAVAGGGAKAQAQSSLATTSDQLVSNGAFTAFTTSVPTGWTASGCTTSKDTRSGWFESTNGYAVRIQASGAAQSLLYQFITNYAAYKGKYVTVAVRLKIPSGQASTAGRIGLTDGVTTNLTTQGPGAARDGFIWQSLTLLVSTAATYLRVIIYCDSAANSGADITVDGVYLTLGVLPRRASEGVPGPTGATGPASPTQIDFLSTLGTNPVFALSASTGSVTLTAANQGMFVPIKPQRDMSITMLQWVSAVASGNYDIALYSASGSSLTRLWSKGSTAIPTAQTLQQETVSPAVALTTGTTYYVGFSMDNTTGSPRGIAALATPYLGFTALLDGTQHARLASSMFPLPASVTLGSTGSYKIPTVVLRES